MKWGEWPRPSDARVRVIKIVHPRTHRGRHSSSKCEQEVWKTRNRKEDSSNYDVGPRYL